MPYFTFLTIAIRTLYVDAATQSIPRRARPQWDYLTRKPKLPAVQKDFRTDASFDAPSWMQRDQNLTQTAKMAKREGKHKALIVTGRFGLKQTVLKCHEKE